MLSWATNKQYKNKTDGFLKISKWLDKKHEAEQDRRGLQVRGPERQRDCQQGGDQPDPSPRR